MKQKKPTKNYYFIYIHLNIDDHYNKPTEKKPQTQTKTNKPVYYQSETNLK